MSKLLPVLFLAAVVGLIGGIAPSNAQISNISPINPFSRSGMADIEKKDLEMAERAAADIYTSETAAVGDLKSWDNEESGNSGTVQLINMFEYQGLPCRRMHHVIELKTERDPRQFTIDRCKTPDGEWKVKY